VRACVFELGDQVTGDLGDPRTVRVGGDTDDVHDPSLHLDHQQHVVAAEEDGVDGEEVGCHDARGLGP